MLSLAGVGATPGWKTLRDDNKTRLHASSRSVSPVRTFRAEMGVRSCIRLVICPTTEARESQRQSPTKKQKPKVRNVLLFERRPSLPSCAPLGRKIHCNEAHMPRLTTPHDTKVVGGILRLPMLLLFHKKPTSTTQPKQKKGVEVYRRLRERQTAAHPHKCGLGTVFTIYTGMSCGTSGREASMSDPGEEPATRSLEKQRRTGRQGGGVQRTR